MLRYLLIILLIAIITVSCEKNNSTTGPKLWFSSDTIHFDTIFTTIGTTTRELRVKNNENRKIIISHVYISGGSGSKFRLNIDGESAWEKKNIEMEPRDSMFIFVDVLIDPNNIDSPVAVTDSIMFDIENETQKVQLLAWGQDINLIDNREITSQIWHNTKPYVIYGNVTVDTLETLFIEEGTNIYFHRNGSLTLAGNLITSGTVASPVIFAGDRLEKMYEDIPGMWKGIFILNTSTGNSFNNTIIRNTVSGIHLGEKAGAASIPDLKLFSTRILHATVSGLSAVNGKIESANTIIAHCGSYCIDVSAGGDYDFAQCTLFNVWDYGFRTSSLVHITEKAASGGRTTQLHFTLKNSVIYGNNISEIEIVPMAKGYTGNYYFDHCLVKLDTATSPFWSKATFAGSFVNKNPLFIEPGVFDFRPDTLSPLINSGSLNYLIDYPQDIRGKSRTDDGKPDIGAFERIPGEHKKLK
jgi:hypothetical protein